jgi:hypothetical protein
MKLSLMAELEVVKREGAKKGKARHSEAKKNIINKLNNRQ